MDERVFIDAIDCAFPYRDRERSFALARQACRTSPACAFMILHELASPPASAGSVLDRVDVLTVIREMLDHPLVEPLTALTERMMMGQYLALDEAKRCLEQMAPFSEALPALGLLVFALADHADAASIEAEAEKIQRAWKDDEGR